MGKHTPGPWIAELNGHDTAARVIAPNGCGPGCPCEVAAEVMPEDARLIAAAPALVEAILNYLRNGIRNGLNGDVDAVMEDALRAAGVIE